jgi:putative ABC transport system permease protein
VADETQLAPAIRRVVRDIDASLPVYNVRTMTEHVETSLALRRIPARMFVVLGPLLLVLAAIGIYAVVAYTVAHRTTEIGVRIALGATAKGVVGQIVGECLRVVVAGAVFGWLIVFMLYTHLVRGAIDLPAFVGVPALLLVVAAVACWIPARRATSVDPMITLRHE